MPSEPPESNFRDRVTHRRVSGARVWRHHLGVSWPARDSMPELPLMEWATVPDEHRSVAMWIVESNWLQVLEGNVDTSHVSFLHSTNDGIPGVREEGWLDKAPRLMVVDSNIGFAYGGRRASQERQLLLARHAVHAADVHAHPWPDLAARVRRRGARRRSPLLALPGLVRPREAAGPRAAVHAARAGHLRPAGQHPDRHLGADREPTQPVLARSRAAAQDELLGHHRHRDAGSGDDRRHGLHLRSHAGSTSAPATWR